MSRDVFSLVIGNDADYKTPLPLTAKLHKLTIAADRRELSPADAKKLESAMRNNKSIG